MSKHVAFLHTSPVHVETFGRIAQGIDPSIIVEHVVVEELLSEAQRVGADNPALIERVQSVMASAASNGATTVICTCSTIGGAAERTPANGFTVARVDRAMANRAVALGPQILIVAALESTLEPTATLIRESATELRTNIALSQLLVPNAWKHFTDGNQTAYIEAVIAAVRPASPGFHVVVLAQASMAPATEFLRDLGIEVLASPLLGVQDAFDKLRGDG